MSGVSTEGSPNELEERTMHDQSCDFVDVWKADVTGVSKHEMPCAARVVACGNNEDLEDSVE